MSTSCTPRAIARAALAATTAAVAAIALASPASATLINQCIEVPQCAQPQTQLCAQIPTVDVRAKADGPWLVEFTANQDQPGQTDGGYEIPLTKGNHVIGVQAEGVEGGFNTGSVGAWGGNLLVRTLYDDTNAGMLPPPP